MKKKLRNYELVVVLLPQNEQCAFLNIGLLLAIYQ